MKKNGLESHFFSLPSLLFLFLSCVFHVCILLSYDFRSHSNFRIFFKAKLLAVDKFCFSFFETLIQKLVMHCQYYLVRECNVLQFLLQNCTCQHGQAGAIC